MPNLTVAEFRAYDHLSAEELMREVERIAVAIFLWQPDADPASSWEALMAKQQAARSALLVAHDAEAVEKYSALIESAFREGFNCGIGAGHDLSSQRERDSDYQWTTSDAIDELNALNRADQRRKALAENETGR